MSFGGVVQLDGTGEYIADANVYHMAAVGQQFVTPTSPNGSFLVLGDWPEGTPFKVSKVGLQPLLFNAPAPGMAVGLYMQPVGVLPDLEVYPDEPQPENPATDPNRHNAAVGFGFGLLGLLWWLLTNADDNGR